MAALDSRPAKGIRNGLALCAQALYAGLVAGFVVGLLRLAEACAGQWRMSVVGQQAWYDWSIPLCFAGMVTLAWVIGRLVRATPDISGSGIPQVELTLHEGYPLKWSRVLWTKFLGAWLALAAGLSLGREGPCIQLGAAVGAGVNAAWRRKALKHNVVIAAGAAAGLGAAFGAPLAGCIFVYEEMRCPLRPWNVAGVLVAVFVAQAVIVLGFGMGRILPFKELHAPVASMYGLLAVFGLLLGLAGVLYNHCLLALKDADARQRIVPASLRLLPALLCAAALMFVAPNVTGGGEGLIVLLGTMTQGASATVIPVTVTVLGVLIVLKFGFSLLSYTGGVPGGLLMPMLCIGALLGATTGQSLLHMQWIAPEQVRGFILLGMAGYFAAIVRAPLTGIGLTLEMTGAWDFLPACLVVSYVACAVANATNTAPVYDSLKMRLRASRTFFTQKSAPM